MRTALACVLGLALSAPMALHAQEVDLDELRTSLDKYQDVNVALADGYIPDPAGHCVTAEMAGAPAELGNMGIHYLHPEILGITKTTPEVNGTSTHTDWSRPAILIYEPQADGSLVLVGLENLVFEEAWIATGEPSPMLNGRPWDYMKDDPATEGHEAHNFAPHYDQHVWLWRENPNGALEPFNAAVTCEHHHGH
jgi:hypothetical protein